MQTKAISFEPEQIKFTARYKKVVSKVIFVIRSFNNMIYFISERFFPKTVRFGALSWLTHIHCTLQGEQGWRSGESARLPPLWPGFDSWTWPHMWVEFVVGSCPCSEGFSPGSPVFLPPQKPTLQILIRSGNSGWRATPWKCHCKCKFPLLLLLLLLAIVWTPNDSYEGVCIMRVENRGT